MSSFLYTGFFLAFTVITNMLRKEHKGNKKEKKKNVRVCPAFLHVQLQACVCRVQKNVAALVFLHFFTSLHVSQLQCVLVLRLIPSPLLTERKKGRQRVSQRTTTSFCVIVSSLRPISQGPFPVTGVGTPVWLAGGGGLGLTITLGMMTKARMPTSMRATVMVMMDPTTA